MLHDFPFGIPNVVLRNHGRETHIQTQDEVVLPNLTSRIRKHVLVIFTLQSYNFVDKPGD